MSLLTRALKAGEGKKVRRLAEIVPLINELEPELERRSDDEIANATVVLRERLANGATLDDVLVEAFATVREAAWRVLGQRHFDVQLMGGMALHFGWIAEMKTGEGKTLVSTLPVYLNALGGEGVHLVTVNDYLARRDAEWMGRVYNFLGLSVGRVTPDVTEFEDKRQAYASDVTYGTNTEFGFDYLRDNMARSRETMTQRGHAFAIVDEVDSILIDEARTPLIISGPSDDAAKLYYQFAGISRTLSRDLDYEVDEEKRIVVPTEAGIEKVERALGVSNMYDLVAVNYVHQLSKALLAKELYHRDKDYLVTGGEVMIIDEFTGRTLEGRRWSDGLHQAVEAKERVKIREENHTWATVTLQNYFRLYHKLAGMTGTAETEAAEFANTYNVPVVPIPTNKPMVREDSADLVYKSEDAKFAAVVEDIAERSERGQPVLVGTASVAKSEHLSSLLEKRGVTHQVLNAKQHAREAEVVSQAGRLHAVTVATNMAGRGVDILLGGNPDGLAKRETVAQGLDLESDEGKAEYQKQLAKFEVDCAKEGAEIRELGGLYVLGSERHESRRIDNQLRGRSGRQGDLGESRFFLSLEDELMRLFATGAMQWVMTHALPDEVPIESRTVTKAIERAQNTVEGRNAEIRKDVLKYDEVLDKQRKVVYELRLQVIDGEDLRERTEELLEQTIDGLVTLVCPTEYPEDWDLELLLQEVTQYFPTQFTVEDLGEATTKGQLSESMLDEALEYYRGRDETFPGGAEQARDIEREVMLQIVDQRWRDHLAEMDYLREGINLRAMGQQDPLVAWQKEGFDMFGQMIESIDDDYLRYVMHVQLVEEPTAGLDLARASYQAADDPVMGSSSIAAAQTGADQESLASHERTEWSGSGSDGPGDGQSRRCERLRRYGKRACTQVSECQDRPQRALLVRQWQEIQNLSWHYLKPRSELACNLACRTRLLVPTAELPRDAKAELADLRSRLTEAEGYLGLEHLRERRDELAEEVSRPDLWDDADTARAVTTELGGLNDDINLLEDLAARQSDAEVLYELMVEEGDDSVESELLQSVDDLERRMGALELRSLFAGEHDANDAIVELHAGSGGTDAQDWCEMLLRMYLRWAERRGFEAEVDEATEGQEAGLLSATLIVKGRFAYGLLSAERGVHRLVRISPFDAQHRRQTSFATVSVIPFLEDAVSVVDIDEKDLRIDTYRSSGAGGQHVNKTDSAVRLTHLPTGIVVSCQNERSQHQNKARAMQILGAKLVDRQEEERRAELESISGPKLDVAWGSQIRSYVLAPYRMVKDHRTDFETGNVDAVLDGDIDDLIEAELRRRRKRGDDQ